MHDANPPELTADRWPVYVLTREASRRLDTLAVERYGLPTLLLMENAGAALAAAAVPRTGRVVAVCGRGNNGGDGLVAARHLFTRGIDVAIMLDETAQPGTEEARTNRELAERFGIAILRGGSGEVAPAVVLDCVLGTGVSSSPRGFAETAIEQINRWRREGARVIAADVPSGLDADTGLPLGACVHADRTVTFGALKPAMRVKLPAAGAVHVAEIGFPEELLRGLACGRIDPVD
jgi:hydroxyethylthiazole kinase-like uncharacterized protein yjeF